MLILCHLRRRISIAIVLIFSCKFCCVQFRLNGDLKISREIIIRPPIFKKICYNQKHYTTLILYHSNPNDSLFLLVLPKVDLCYLLANCNFKTNIYLFLNFFFQNSLITCEYHYATEKNDEFYFIIKKKKHQILML